MKFLYKLVIINLLFISLYAKDDLKIYEQYADYLVNYTVNLPKDLKDPFLGLKIRKYKKVQILNAKEIKKTKKIKTKKKIYTKKYNTNLNIEILAIFITNDKKEALLRVNSRKKTVKEGEFIIGDYKLQKIINSDTILVSNKNITKIIKMKKNNINIKVIR